MKNLYYYFVKTPFDYLISLFLIIAFCPIFIVTSLLVYFQLGAPIIYKQRRPGLNEAPFYLLKFRTMTNAKNREGELLPNEERLTQLGKILRSFSIDELPGLFDVLRGEMSLVGPRPLRMRYLPHYTRAERIRHNVKPGLTGLAQVNGRNTINWESKLSYDIKYVESVSFTLDLIILIRTIVKVISKSDITPVNGEFEVPFDEIRKRNEKD